MTRDPRDYKVNVSGISPSDLPVAGGASSAPGKPYLSVLFACCGVYQRIYRAADGKSYSGHCPRCAKPVRFLVGEGGSQARFFRVE